MPSGNAAHLSDEQLARFQDETLPERESGHLQSCAQCSSRRQDLRAAFAAYAEYRDAIRAPLLPQPPRPWQSLDALIDRHMASRPARAFQWWWALPALAAAAGLVAVFMGLPGRPQDSTRANKWPSGRSPGS